MGKYFFVVFLLSWNNTCFHFLSLDSSIGDIFLGQRKRNRGASRVTFIHFAVLPENSLGSFGLILDKSACLITGQYRFSEEYFSAKYSLEKYFLLDAVNIVSLRPFGESGLLRNAVILSATVWLIHQIYRIATSPLLPPDKLMLPPNHLTWVSREAVARMGHLGVVWSKVRGQREHNAS